MKITADGVDTSTTFTIVLGDGIHGALRTAAFPAALAFTALVRFDGFVIWLGSSTAAEPDRENSG
jgi:hypothetical protein